MSMEAPPQYSTSTDNLQYTSVSQKLFPSLGPYPVTKVSSATLQNLTSIATQWGISRLFKERMPNLVNKEFVFLFDDSGSMRNTDRGATMSRWLELKEFAKYAIALSSAFDHDGVDIYFLNRPKVEHVKTIDQLHLVFKTDPTDYCLTPLSASVEQILYDKKEAFMKGNMILVIATDGEPRSNDGTDSIQTFTQTLSKRHHLLGIRSLSQIPISIRACTNDMSSIGYLNKLDQNDSLFLDVSDDYEAERIEIQQVLGNDFVFSYGDYILKCLIGSCDEWMDKLDEPKKLTFEEIRYQKFGEIPSDMYVQKQNKKGLKRQKKRCVIQ